MSKAKAKGTTAEREVVRYLQNWWPAAERRALSGNKDKGDVSGIPDTVIEVKAAKTPLIGPWKRETLKEMDNAGVGLCLLVVKRPYKSVAEWDAYMPAYQTLMCNDSRVYQGSHQWVRMDFALAASVLWQIES